MAHPPSPVAPGLAPGSSVRSISAKADTVLAASLSLSLVDGLILYSFFLFAVVEGLQKSMSVSGKFRIIIFQKSAHNIYRSFTNTVSISLSRIIISAKNIHLFVPNKVAPSLL